LKEKMMSQNPTQINARLTEQSSLLDYKISNSSYLPQLNFSGSYSYFRNESEGSFLQLNETLGYGLGLTLSVPLFTGGTRRSAQKNAKILMENSKILNEETSRTLEKQLLIAYRDYQNSMQAFELEQTSLETAELNFELSEERFAIGQISNVDFRTAQLNLLMSQNNLNNLQYNTQLTALEVLRLSGQLMK
ncbi:MAG: TolC family protein, partial [Bacteroidetes bacterium]|nr:TolC family protein [Bacteroidota bacterium]